MYAKKVRRARRHKVPHGATSRTPGRERTKRRRSSSPHRRANAGGGKAALHYRENRLLRHARADSQAGRGSSRQTPSKQSRALNNQRNFAYTRTTEWNRRETLL